MLSKILDKYLRPHLHRRLTESPYRYRDFKAALLGVFAACTGMLMMNINMVNFDSSAGLVFFAIPLASAIVLTGVLILTGRIKGPVFIGVLIACSMVGAYTFYFGGLYLKSIYWMILPISLLILVRGINLALVFVGMLLAFLLFIYFGDYSNYELAISRINKHDVTDALIGNIAYTITLFGLMYMFHLNSELSLNLYQKELDEKNKQNEELSKILEELKQTQNQLIESEKMASLGLLTAGVAHEINNPINFINSSTEALKLDFEDLKKLLILVVEIEKSEDPAKVEELREISRTVDSKFLSQEMDSLIKSIERGGIRTMEIVKNLRTFSRDSGEAFLHANIHEGIDGALVLLDHKMSGRIALYKDYAELPLVPCQISRLNQVFLNIVDNAIHSIEGMGEIFIKTLQQNGEVRIVVSDTGKGMEEQTIQRLFEPFFTTKEVGQGTGLGLSISYGIIEQHGGKIEVKSKLDKGSTFTICLPFEAT